MAALQGTGAVIKRILVELGLWAIAGVVAAIVLMWIMDVLR